MAVQGSRNEDKITPYLDPNQQDLLLAALNAQAQDKSGQAKQNANMSGNALFMSPQDAQLDNLDYTPDLDYLDGDNSFDFDNADLGGEMIGALPARTSLDEGHEKRKSRDDGDAADEGDAKRQETQDGERTGKKPGRKPLTNEPTTKRKAQNRAAQRAFRERKEKHLKDLETKVSELSKTHEADQHENGMLKAQVERLQVELREYRKRLSLNSGAARSSPPLTAYTGQNRSASNSLSGGNFQFDFPKFGALPGSQMFGSQENLPDSSNNGVLQRGSVTPPLSNSQSTQSFHGKGSIPPAQFSNTDSQHSQGGRSISPATNLSRSGSNAPTPPQKYGNFPAVGYSTNDNMHGFASTLPQMNSENPFGDLFSPTLLKNANFDNQNGYFNNAHQSNSNAGSALKSTYDVGNGGESTAGLNRVFQFNGGSSSSDSASPSASSTSQWNANANSSCGTSPEPAHDSPTAKAQHQDSYSSEKSTSLRNGTTAQTQCNSQAASGGNPNIALVGNSLDYSVPTTNTFDPVLFGDYRDNPDNLFGTTTDFGTNAFFDDALNTAPFDYGSPSNLFGILQSPQQTHDTLSTGASPAANAPTPSRNLMAVMDKARDGGDDDYGLPTTMTQQPQKKVDASGGKLISCNNIWNQLQSNPDFQNGTFDLDSLCSELRAKARCSESGVMVSQDHVDAALKKLGKKDEAGRFVPNREKMDLPPLMFEQESWDNVLKKLGGSAQ